MFDKKIFFIVMAGGIGRRMGADEPKQFLLIDGKPIICHTIEKLVSIVPECHIVTVLPKDFIEYWKTWCITHNFHIAQTIAEGGITRFHSVKNALQKVPDGAIVAIHDAVRPFVSEVMLDTMLKKMENERALVPVIPVIDSLVSLKKTDDVLEETGDAVDRSRIYSVQTPQIFLSEEIKQAYDTPYETSFTDDASVARKKGIPVSYCEGDRYNIKITTPEDLELGEFICGKISSCRKK